MFDAVAAKVGDRAYEGAFGGRRLWQDDLLAWSPLPPPSDGQHPRTSRLAFI